MKQNLETKKNITLGFTLIELLAVIVILAIIVLIVTPVLLKMKDDTNIESMKASVDLYARAVMESAINRGMISGNNDITGKYSTTDGRTLVPKLYFTHNLNNIEVEYDGDVVCKSIEIYDDGSIYLNKCFVNGTEIDYAYGERKNLEYTNTVYFDIVTGRSCSKEIYEKSWSEEEQDYLNSLPEYNGLEETRTSILQNSCLKFYSFENDNEDKINLLLDHNTTKYTYGFSRPTGYYYYGISNLPLVTDAMASDVRLWNAPIIDETTNMKTRLFSYDEVLKISDGVGENSECIYDRCSMGWILDRTASNCKDNGCPNNSYNGSGYFISGRSIDGEYVEGYYGSSTWFVHGGPDYSRYCNDPSMIWCGVSSYIGFRPIIEVYKSSLE